MKKVIGFVCIICMIALYSCSNQSSSLKESEKGKPVVMIFGDFKCSYCKKVEENVMSQLKKKYIDTNNVKFQYVNLAFLGKDSIIGSRAQHAVNHYAPKYSLQFQKSMFK